MPPRRRGRQPDVRPPLKGISKFAPKLCPPLHALVFLPRPSLLPVRLVPSISDGDCAILASLPRSVRLSVRPSLSFSNSYFSNFDFYGNDIEPTYEEGRRAPEGETEGSKDAFSSQNDGNCSSNDGTETEGEMEGRDRAPFHARYFRPG